MSLVQKHLMIRLMALCLAISTSLLSTVSYAGFSTTETVISSNQHQYDKDELLQALSTAEVEAQLVELGVDPQQVKDRVASMTAEEVQQLNAELAEMPAGAGILGVALTLFIVFVITDMLCATDIFGFVNCIN